MFGYFSCLNAKRALILLLIRFRKSFFLQKNHGEKLVSNRSSLVLQFFNYLKVVQCFLMVSIKKIIIYEVSLTLNGRADNGIFKLLRTQNPVKPLTQMHLKGFQSVCEASSSPSTIFVFFCVDFYVIIFNIFTCFHWRQFDLLINSFCLS